MAEIRIAPIPRQPLWRLGRRPNPLAWPPRLDVLGTGRFDDPERHWFCTLYASEQRRACFNEVLAQYRLDLAVLARLKETEGDEPLEIARPVIEARWVSTRAIGRLQLQLSPHDYLDLRSPDTCEALRPDFAALAKRSGLADIDVSAVRTARREFSQQIASWAYGQGFAGIAYRSRFDDRHDCWALFSGRARFARLDVEPIQPDDPDLLAAAQLIAHIPHARENLEAARQRG